jgi:sec-independent protein translocase protein TatA
VPVLLTQKTKFMTHLLLAIGGLGIWELVIILVIILVIFGVGKLPEIGSGLGKGIRNFKKGIKGDEEEEEEEPRKPQDSLKPPRS